MRIEPSLPGGLARTGTFSHQARYAAARLAGKFAASSGARALPSSPGRKPA